MKAFAKSPSFKHARTWKFHVCATSLFTGKTSFKPGGAFHNNSFLEPRARARRECWLWRLSLGEGGREGRVAGSRFPKGFEGESGGLQKSSLMPKPFGEQIPSCLWVLVVLDRFLRGTRAQRAMAPRPGGDDRTAGVLVFKKFQAESACQGRVQSLRIFRQPMRPAFLAVHLALPAPI